MTLSDFFKLIRHYIKMVIIVPVVCAFVATAVVAAIPPTYIAKATLLTNGDIARFSRCLCPKRIIELL